MSETIIMLLEDGYEVSFYWLQGDLHIVLNRAGYIASHSMTMKEFFDMALLPDIEEAFIEILEKLEMELEKKGRRENEET